MNDLISKLAADLRWRLSKAGKQFKPALKERESWGTFRFPPLASVLIWFAVMMLSSFAADEMGGGESVFFWMFVNTLSTITVTLGVDRLNKHLAVRSYRNLLQTNERFTLVEYAKYIKRQIQRARQDPALGGPAEVQRLQTVYHKLNALLQKGVANDPFKVESQLSKEADLAEAVIESYDLPAYDELAELDKKLPENLRERLAELENEPLAAPAASRARE